MVFPTLDDAIAWVTDRWGYQRSVPRQLHVREEEGVGLMRDRSGCGCLACTDGPPADRGLGSHAFSRPFVRILDGSLEATSFDPITVDCHHPQLAGTRLPARDCPECGGLGLKESTTERYMFPMSRALQQLSKTSRSPRRPHSYELVVTLAAYGWNVEPAARAFGLEPLPWFLTALRQLHAKYEEAPLRTSPSWVDLSDSQQQAILAG